MPQDPTSPEAGTDSRDAQPRRTSSGALGVLPFIGVILFLDSGVPAVLLLMYYQWVT